MTLHLIKLAVGVESMDHLADLQRVRREARQKRKEMPELMHITRMWPKRQDELLDGGSIYWVIKGVVRCRQRLTGFFETLNGQGLPSCGLALDPQLVAVAPRGFRAFQGWRYLTAADAPADRPDGAAAEADLPAEMAEELRGLGLI